MSVALVVPTCREEQIREFLVSWEEQIHDAGITTYVVEDAPRTSFSLPFRSERLRHLCWASAPKGMLDCIDVRSPACRQIGFFHAHIDGAEVIVTLDDDVRPGDGGNAFVVFRDVLLKGVPVWVDPLLNYRSRGYPEANVGAIPVAFHVGSFLTIPDVSGETQLRHAADFVDRPPRYLPRPTIVPARQLIPVNGGVCAWRRELSPYVHYAIWDDHLGYYRFDDIWMGVILKRLLDHCGLAMSYGPPAVHHLRASDAERNVVLESAGKRFNEVFWSELDSRLARSLDPAEKSLPQTWRAIADVLRRMPNRWARREGQCMLQWSSFFG